ncbi:MAG: S8 family peptidase, partial [Chthonomonadales bacterium]
EQLVEVILPPPRAPRESRPYTINEARERLAPRAAATIASFRQVPKAALPDDEGVAALTLHPQYLSKSAFPVDLLTVAGLRAIGSKPTRVTPEKVARLSEPKEEATATIFVAGKLTAFESLSRLLEGPISAIPQRAADDLTAVEDFRAMTREDRLGSINFDSRTKVLECVLHARANNEDHRIITAFEQYAKGLGLHVDREKELFASGLCFVALRGDLNTLDELALFSFLRRVRLMPRMRPLLPGRIARAATGIPVQIPNEGAIDESLTAAVFDTSLPTEHALAHIITSYDYNVTPYADDDARLHGLCVSSAAILGPLDNTQAGRSPYRLDHHGVLGNDPDGSGYHMALKTIQETVRQNDYSLFNLSFGPDGAIADDDIDAFTAVIDELLADGKRLCFIAVGNDGDLDESLQLNRIQPPSDSVNGLSVGSVNSRQNAWRRADYSCVGPGRHGCRVKPDLVAFGGSMDEPFGCIGPGNTPDRYNTQGTSFASPTAMRVAGNIIAAMGEQLTRIAVRALILHGCRIEDRDKKDVGHGLIQSDLAKLLTCDPNEVKVVYQGNLAAGKTVRHRLPLPPDLQGLVEIQATLCFASPVDPSFPSSYVQAGVEVLFRPHSERFGTITDEDGTIRSSMTIKSESLFNQGRAYGSADDRRDAHLWDTVLNVSKNKRAASLLNPVVDLHYNRRQEGRPDSSSIQPEIPYSLVFTLRCRAVNNLYDQVRTRFGANVRVLTPRIEIPIRV